MFAVKAEQLTRNFAVPTKGQSIWRRVFAPQRELVKAVSNVSLEINEGEVVGYIGPNGAGKSTTMKMLLGILYPSSGTVQVLGRDPFKERLANNQEIGVVWGNRNVMAWDIPVADTLDKFRRIYRVSQPDFQQRLNLCNEYLELDSLMGKHGRHLSLGQRMRCNLVASVLHRPRILYLDEPTIGLDVVVKHQVRRFLRHLNQAWGTTILLTTHDLADIEDLCPRIVVIDKGRLILDDTLEAVRDRLGDGVKITFQLSPGTVLDPHFLEETKRAFPGVTLRTEPGARLVLQVARVDATPIALVRWVVNRIEPIHLQITESPIEDVVSRIYSGGELCGA